MRVLFLTGVAIVLLGCGTSLAQIAAVPNATMPPSSTQAPALPGIVTPPRPAGSAGSTLGAIQLNLGTPIVGGTLGAIQVCPATGTAAAIANFPVDVTDVTANTAPGFGTSAISGNCNVGLPVPSPAAIGGSELGNGAVPLSTPPQASAPGLSPLIAAPVSAMPNAACAADLSMAGMTGVPTPYDSMGAVGTPYDSTGAVGTPSQSGC
jgi:hypothetical protein